ncbi:hypothetical protein HQN90_30150 [Paenibacillus alba]|uniref:hypothetical protein n=1 Tax=Paenibacillus alba TaxID=1197127 RepID=UPI001567040E|nr:hypothetical protein [Paenibacillus alba]NQX70410.1 hypothetical protein [Paenibacillus alba]
MNFFKKPINEIRTKFELELLHKAQVLPESNPPPPWIKEIIVPASGCFACGWDLNENLILISSSGYSITEVSSGILIHRNRDSELTNARISSNNLTFHTPYNDEVIDIFGFEAGDGIHTTIDGWFVKVIYPWWPRASVIIENLFKPNYQYLNDVTMIELKRLYGDIKCGFSPSGQNLVILGSGGALIYSRN